MTARVQLGVLAAPIVALSIGIWAEFADLGPLLLLAVALPAMAVSGISVALAYGARPLALVLTGAAVGFATFAIAEGLYLSIHYARGGTLDFESLNSQPAMAAALFGIHVAVGILAGLALGCAGAVVAYVAAARGRAVSRTA